MGALHINGQKTTGLNINLADGVFIDTDNVIVPQTTYTESSSWSYTATEDCCVYIDLVNKNGYGIDLLVDGLKFGSVYDDSKSIKVGHSVLMKAGQVLSLSASQYPSGATTKYAVYGIQQGTIEGKLQPVIYSLEEREIGVWTDGKPLYEKTLIGQITAGGDTDVDLSSLNIDNFILVNASAERINTNAGSIIYSYAGIDTNVNPSSPNLLRFNFKFYKQSKILKVTSYTVSTAEENVGNYIAVIQYTKTTDQPGAGTWTPDGAYAHHYSTDEKVVGTWIDGSTIYEITTDMGTAGVSIPAGASKDSNIPIGNIDKIIYSQAISQSGKYFPVIGAELGGSYVQMINMGSSNRNVRWFTIQYTKSS